MRNTLKANTKLLVLICIIFLAGLGIRLYDLTDPPLDFHPTRQLRSAIIARGIYYEGLPDSAQKSIALQTAGSLEAYEPPIFETIVAGVYRISGGEKLWVSRIIGSLFWMIAAGAFTLLLYRWGIRFGILVSAGFFFFLTFGVLASRSFQPDPFMVMWISLFALSVDIWEKKRSLKWAVLVGLIGGIAILIKVVAVFFVAGVILFSIFTSTKILRVLTNRQVWLILILCIVPPAAYYLIAIGVRSAGFFTAWTVSFLPLLIDHEFYSDWLHMIDSLVSLPIFFTALIGSLLYPNGQRKLMLGLWVGYVLYGLTSPFQFITHSYYHLPLLLITALGMAPAVDMVMEKVMQSSWLWRTAGALVLVFAAGYSLWVARSVLYVENFKSEANVWQKIGESVPNDGPVIALTQDYGNRLMYYGWTKVGSYWPATSNFSRGEAAGKKSKDFDALFLKNTDGKRYFLVTAFGQLEQQPELKQMLSNFEVTGNGDGYVVYDLSQPLITPK